MKILALRLKNLNALYGEWSIDFTDPEFLSNGIFALTGPTGAGKSTILDAICLALYGATPRLGRITQSTNEIMSRQTGECYAEVTFESQAIKYLCHWEQRRSWKNPTGPLQAPEHQIANATDGKILESKKSLVLGVIEAKTGMDFDRFTRSILLAQGGFDTFLKANAEEKSKILEQITGTAIYSDISRRVHERQRSEKEKLMLLEAETSNISLLEPEAIEALTLEIYNNEQTEVGLVNALQTIQTEINWLKSIETLRQEVVDSSLALDENTKALAAFMPTRKQLEKAMRAATLTSDYTEVQNASKQIKADEAQLQTALAQLPALKQATAQQSAAFKQAELAVVQAKNGLQENTPIIQQVRSLDQTIADLEKVFSQGNAAISEAKTNMQQHVEAKQTIQANLDAANARMVDVGTYLQANAPDEALISNLSGIESQLSQLAKLEHDMQQEQALLNKAETAYKAAKQSNLDSTKKVSDAKQTLTTAKAQHEQAATRLTALLNGKLLREYRTEKDTLLREIALHAKIAELEDHRQQLVDGKPCPLCGAAEHPFASGTLPKQDETEVAINALTTLIDKAEAYEVQISAHEKAVNQAQQALTVNENEATHIAHEITSLEESIGEINNKIAQLQGALTSDTNVLSSTLVQFGISTVESKDTAALLASLKSRLQRWQQQTKEQEAIAREIAIADTELTRLNATIESAKKALSVKQLEHATIEKNYLETKTKRQTFYGDKDPNREDELLHSALLTAEAKVGEARLQNETATQKEQETQTQIRVIQERIAAAQAPFETLKEAFISTMQAAGFADQQAFRDARITPEAQAALTAKQKALDDQYTALNAKQKDRETRLALVLEKQVTTETLATLEPAYLAKETSIKELRDSIARLKQQLINHAQALASIQDKQALISAHQQECARWDKLHALIGSADGKKFRNFAQGLTFELMVNHANQQLEKMTDRYLLMRDKTLPLALNVVDNYQAGEIRSTKNLSGGESFIVSLTLALGLSKMASRKVRIDSLFLDEGFGTLDEDALETALETLSGLHQEGKLIGIISHVGALKERIQTQIAVSPLSGGKSALSGPGCTKIG